MAYFLLPRYKWTTYDFKLDFHSDLNYTLIKLLDCVSHSCDAIVLKTICPQTDGQTDRHINLTNYSKLPLG